MANENQSALVDVMEMEQKMNAARTNGMTHIQRLIPYLQYREKAAEKYWHPDGTAETRKNFGQVILHCNKEIKEILGL